MLQVVDGHQCSGQEWEQVESRKKQQRNSQTSVEEVVGQGQRRWVEKLKGHHPHEQTREGEV